MLEPLSFKCWQAIQWNHHRVLNVESFWDLREQALTQGAEFQTISGNFNEVVSEEILYNIGRFLTC